MYQSIISVIATPKYMINNIFMKYNLAGEYDHNYNLAGESPSWHDDKKHSSVIYIAKVDNKDTGHIESIHKNMNNRNN